MGAGLDSAAVTTDSALAVHPNMRSQNGAGLTLGRGFAISISSAQKLTVGNQHMPKLYV